MGPSEPSMDAFKAGFRKIYVCQGGGSSYDEFGEIFVFSGMMHINLVVRSRNRLTHQTLVNFNKLVCFCILKTTLYIAVYYEIYCSRL